MRAPYSRIPAVPVALSLAVGILLCDLTEECVIIPIIALVLVAVAALLRRGWFAAIAFAVAVGWFICVVHAPAELPDDLADQRLEVIGVVEEIDEDRVTDVERGGDGGGYTHLVLKVLATGLPPKYAGEETSPKVEPPLSTVRCAVNVRSVAVDVAPGDTISMITKLRHVSNYPDLPYTFEYGTYLRHCGINATAWHYGGGIRVVGRAGRWRRTVVDMRNAIHDAIVKSPVSPETASFLLAVMLGEDNLLMPQTESDFRASGLAHMLAISGLHIGILVWILSLVLFPLRAVRGGRLRFVVIIAVVWIYAYIVGLPVSVVRAAVMVTVFYCARLLQRSVSGFNTLAVAVIVILVADPLALFQPGFQLSVAAVASILWFVPIMVPKSMSDRRLYFVANALAVPVAAVIGTGLVTVAWFHRFPVAFMISNVLVCAVLPLFMLVGAFMVVLTLLGCNPRLLGNVIDVLYTLINDVTETFSRGVFADIQGIWLPTSALIAGAILVIAIAIAVRYRQRFMIPVVGCLLVVFVLAVRVGDRLASGENLIGGAEDCELWLLGSKESTDMLVRSGDSVIVVSTAPASEWGFISRNYASRYEGYLVSHGCRDSLQVRGLEFSHGPCVGHRGYIAMGTRSLLVVDNDSVAVDRTLRPDYVVVGGGFKGDVVALHHLVQGDTLVLSSAANRKRGLRYWTECENAGIPVIDIRNHGPLRVR